MDEPMVRFTLEIPERKFRDPIHLDAAIQAMKDGWQMRGLKALVGLASSSNGEKVQGPSAAEIEKLRAKYRK
jgi:hypothetical protein